MKVPLPRSPRLVVRADEPGRRGLLVFVMLLLVGLSLWGAFEWGRGNLGLPGGITPDRVALRERVQALENEVRTLRVELAQRESERVGQARERTELARTIGSLRADVQQLESELGFYRGVVGTSSRTQTVKVQQFRVSRTEEANVFRVRLVLGRALDPEGTVSGKLRITIEGTNGADPASLDLAAVAGIEGGELPYSYRYLSEVEQLVRLPAGFTPARTFVELVPAQKGVNPVRETFLWTVEN
jgi:hypothetical protein